MPRLRPLKRPRFTWRPVISPVRDGNRSSRAETGDEPWLKETMMSECLTINRKLSGIPSAKMGKDGRLSRYHRACCKAPFTSNQVLVLIKFFFKKYTMSIELILFKAAFIDLVSIVALFLVSWSFDAQWERDSMETRLKLLKAWKTRFLFVSCMMRVINRILWVYSIWNMRMWLIITYDTSFIRNYHLSKWMLSLLCSPTLSWTEFEQFLLNVTLFYYQYNEQGMR